MPMPTTAPSPTSRTTSSPAESGSSEHRSWDEYPHRARAVGVTVGIEQTYKATIETPHGPRTCLQVSVERDRGRRPLVARFGGLPLRRQRTAVPLDQRPVLASAKRNELIHRLLAERCEICTTRENLEVHHIRKLADLNRPGRPEKPAWMHLMAKRRRKTLVICRPCHEDIHAGRATVPIR